MKELKFYTHYYEKSNTHEYAYAYVVDEIPKIGDHVHFIYDDEVVDFVNPALMDCEQPTDDVWNYDIYEVNIFDANNEEDIDWVYVAVKSAE